MPGVSWPWRSFQRPLKPFRHRVHPCDPSTQSQAVDWNASPKGKLSQFPWPAKRDDLSISHQGTGKPWADHPEPCCHSFERALLKRIQDQEDRYPGRAEKTKQWSRGDVVRIRLEMEAQADQTWVVVSDPVPAGARFSEAGSEETPELLTKGGREERLGLASL